MNILYYAVFDEHTLGYVFILDGREVMGILHTSLLRGSSYNGLGGYIEIGYRPIRVATQKDFDDYRVSSVGHLCG